MIRFYATVARSYEILVFAAEAAALSDDIVARFPNTRVGWKAAMALTGELNG